MFRVAMIGLAVMLVGGCVGTDFVGPGVSVMLPDTVVIEPGYYCRVPMRLEPGREGWTAKFDIIVAGERVVTIGPVRVGAGETYDVGASRNEPFGLRFRFALDGVGVPGTWDVWCREMR